MADITIPANTLKVGRTLKVTARGRLVQSEICPQCRGARWTCEAHPDRPWPHDDCSGPGEPCASCNTGSPPDLGADWISLVKAKPDA